MDSMNRGAIVASALALTYVLSFPSGPKALQDFDKFERIAQALEAYALDYNGTYPSTPNGYLPNALTTPVAYLAASAMVDPLTGFPNAEHRFQYIRIKGIYQAPVQAMYGDWLVFSSGYRLGSSGTFSPSMQPILYDATNGTISKGMMMRSQRAPVETGAALTGSGS